MNYDVYSHFPVLAVMCYFVGAFIVTLIGKRRAARTWRRFSFTKRAQFCIMKEKEKCGKRRQK